MEGAQVDILQIVMKVDIEALDLNLVMVVAIVEAGVALMMDINLIPAIAMGRILGLAGPMVQMELVVAMSHLITEDHMVEDINNYVQVSY